MNIEEVINSRGLKASSANNYIRTLKKLQKDYGSDDLEQSLKEDSELNTFNSIFEGKSHHTKKTYLIAIHSLLCGKSHGNGAVCDHVTAQPFHTEMNQINKKIVEFDDKQEKTEKQSDNWATLDELKSLMKDYQKKVKPLLHENASLKDIMEIEKWVVLSLYLSDDSNPPIRSEYGDMIITHTMKDMDKNVNYLMITGPRKKEIILNNYKTDGKYGQKIFKVGKVLNKVLNTWLKVVGHKDGDPLLLKKTGGIMGRANLSKFLVEITKPLGKRISIQMMRHIFISEKIIQPKLSEKSELADKMCHSVGTQTSYIKY
tara:strand:- start:290 stop:1237 length:948 start_codon:yes stop_codon:yes gene_type:complete